MELGLGAGWLMEEAHVLGHPSDHPSGRLAETIQLLRATWRDDALEWHGRFHEPSQRLFNAFIEALSGARGRRGR